MKIVIDSMSSQVQVQNETGHRLNTLLGAITSMGYSYGGAWSHSFTDYTRPISRQLDGADVLVILTHQRAVYPDLPPAIPDGVSFSFFDDDLKGIPEWVAAGKGLLLVSNHGSPTSAPPFWPVNDAVLAKQFGITIDPACFTVSPGPLTMPPASGAPARLTDGVSQVVANNSCGIRFHDTTVIVPLPPGTRDRSINRYNPADYAFGVLKPWGKGQVIVAGNSGTSGDRGNDYPANGRIPSGNNLSFYLNCLAFLGGVSATTGALADAGQAGEELAAASPLRV